MSAMKIERVLVQGTVTFTVTCDDLQGMVTPEQGADKEFMKEWFTDKAFKIIDSANEDVEYENEVKVLISQETADKHTDKTISSEDWKTIIAEHRNTCA